MEKVKIKLNTGTMNSRTSYEIHVIKAELGNLHYVLNTNSQFILVETISGKKLIVNKDRITTCEVE